MAWCPTCKAEFVEGIVECPECQIALVAELPEEEMEYIPDSWEVAAEYGDEVTGALAEGLLQDNGIPCRLENLSFGAGPVIVSQGLTRTRIWVEKENFEDAKKLLGDVENYCFCSECGAVVLKEDQSCTECGASLEG